MKGSDSFFNGYNSAGSRDVKVVKSVSTSTSHSLPKTSEPNSVKIVYKNGKKQPKDTMMEKARHIWISTTLIMETRRCIRKFRINTKSFGKTGSSTGRQKDRR